MMIRRCKYCRKEFSHRMSPSDVQNNKGVYCSRACVNKDRVFAPETIRKMGLAKLGCIPWNKGLKGFRAGEKSHLWKGGITNINSKIRNSLDYRNLVKEVLSENNYTCKICGKRGGNIQVDHIKPFSLFPDLRLEKENLRILCIRCHILKTGLDMNFVRGKWSMELFNFI